MSSDDLSRRRQADGYEPRFDLDLAWGEQGQLFVEDIATAISRGLVEVKRDGRWHQTGNLYAEYKCRKVTGEWARSGIAATDATVCAFVLGDTEVALFVPTELLRQFMREAYKKSTWYRIEERDGSHPTRGVKVPIREFFHWLALRQTQMRRGAA
jgi:hypothetical protein